MKRKKIIFFAPKNKGGTYYYYKDISTFIKTSYSSNYEIIFSNGFLDYIKYHFVKSDIIFSIIPFIFKPLFCKKFVYNLHGNYEKERQNKGLGVKLLYFSKMNLDFADNIILLSNYLGNKLGFGKKYSDKIIIIPNYIKNINTKNLSLEENKYNFMTVTSFDFYEKGRGVINLINVLRNIAIENKNKQIIFNIIGNIDGRFYLNIKKEAEDILIPNNLIIIWKGWLAKKDLDNEFLNNNSFLYWTNLDNYPGVLLEALSYNMKVYINNYESFKYFLGDSEIICKDENEMTKKIFKNTKIDFDKIKLYSLEDIAIKFYEIIK